MCWVGDAARTRGDSGEQVEQQEENGSQDAACYSKTRFMQRATGELRTEHRGGVEMPWDSILAGSLAS